MSNNDPHALENLPPLDGWTNEALVRDFMCHLARTENADVIDMNADANALRDEILRRMSDNRTYP